MKFQIQYQVEYVTDIECEPEELSDYIADIDIPENSTSEYMDDSYYTLKILDDKGNDVTDEHLC